MRFSLPPLSAFTKSFIIRYFIVIVPITAGILWLTLAYEGVLLRTVEGAREEGVEELFKIVEGGVLAIRLYAITIIFSFLFFFFAGTLLSDWLAFRPIPKILKAMDRLGRGDFSARLKQTSRDEIGQISAHFNAMAEALAAAKKAEEQAAAAQLELLSAQAFRFRNALATAKWSLALFHEETPKLPLTASHQSRLAVARGAIEGAIKSVNELLEFGVIETERFTYHREPVDINEFLAAIAKEFAPSAAAKNIEFSLAADFPDHIRTSLDATHMRIALMHLLMNALQYTSSGGKIVLRASHEKGRCIVAVQDTGIGIPAAELPRLFEKFFRGEQALRLGIAGMGLGLYAARRVVEQHGGAISVESQEGHGSTFRITLLCS